MSGPLDPTPLARELHGAGVRHVVIGGFAVIAHGVVRVTEDLDICPDPEPANLGRLASSLACLGADQLGVGDFDTGELPFDPTRVEDLAQGGNFRLITALGALDVMQCVPGIPGEHAYRQMKRSAIA